MSKLIDQLKDSSPNVKLGLAVATGVAVGVVATIGVQSYGGYKERKVRKELAKLEAPVRFSTF